MFKFRKTAEEKVLADINKEPTKKERREQSAEEAKMRDDFDLDTALNDPAFVEFLAQYPKEELETIDMSEHNEALIDRFVLFKSKDSLSKAMKDVFSQQVELESGVNVSEDLDSVDEYFSKMVVENPEKFKEIMGSRNMFEKSVAELEKTQNEIKEILGDLNKSELETKIEDLSYAKSLNFFNTLFNKEARQEKRDILDKYGLSKADLKQALEIEIAKVDTLDEVQRIQEAVLKQFLDAQDNLLSKEFEPLQKAREKALQKIKTELTSVKRKKIENVEVGDIDAIADKIRMVKESGNYVPEYQKDLDALEENLSAMVQKLLQEKLEKAVVSLGKNKISTLEKSINNVFDQMTARGLRTPENNELVLEKLEELAEKTKSLPKKLLIKRMIIKLNK
jgi:hypothetical protein